MKNWPVGIGVLLAFVVCMFVVFLPKDRHDGATHPMTASPTPASSHTLVPIEVRTGTSTDSTDWVDTETPTQLPRYEHPVRNAQRAALIRQALIAQNAQKLAGPPEPKNMPEREGTGNQVGKPMGNYVNRIMQEQFVPMATECYENLLTQHPNVAGNVELEFSILGDTSVGGVVVDVSLGQATTLTDPEFRTCMTESMFAVVFDPPPGDDGSVSVTQSFELAP